MQSMLIYAKLDNNQLNKAKLCDQMLIDAKLRQSANYGKINMLI